MRELQVFIAYLIFIIFAETVTMFVDTGYGLYLYFFILVSLLTIFSIKPDWNPKLYLSLSLAPLIRIISISTSGQVISDILLIILLASKEIVDTDTRLSLQIIGKTLTIVIVPLLISFTINISSKFL